MTGQIRFTIDPKLRLTLVYYQGLINWDIVIEHVFKMKSDPAYNRNYNAITEFGMSELDFSQEEISRMAQGLMEQDEIFGNRKHAFIANSSKQLSVASMFSLHTMETKVDFNIVRSLREALEFVNIKLDDYPRVMQLFKNMRY